ncbi:MAG: UdgX family uracil-DNA binding protein, partial [Thermoanaerobaculia bacterium]
MAPVREVVIAPTLEAWRDAARRLIEEKVLPEQIAWRELPAEGAALPGLFDEPPTPEPAGGTASASLLVPREFLEIAGAAASHPDPGRWRLLYSVLY